jgi:hypothetical protein
MLATLAFIVVAGCVSATPEQIAAAQRGRDDAKRDLALGRARRAMVGSVRDDESALDAATGLAQFSAGCCKSTERLAYCAAYNEVVEVARDAGRLKGRTLERKATTRAAVEALFASGAGVEVALEGPGATSPDGRFLVRVGMGYGREGLALSRVEVATQASDELRYLGSERVRVVFAADGTTLYLRDDAVRAYSSFDLPGALFLEVFPDPPRVR